MLLTALNLKIATGWLLLVIAAIILTAIAFNVLMQRLSKKNGEKPDSSLDSICPKQWHEHIN
jgi:hypothetical protein